MRFLVRVRAVLICTGYLAILSQPVCSQTPGASSEHLRVVIRPHGCPVLLDAIDVPLILVHDVKFDGQITLPESDREKFVSDLKQKGLFATPDWVDGIAIDAQKMWLDHGYSHVVIEPEARTFSIDAEGEHVFLTFHVNEGPKHWLKQVRFHEKDSTVSDPETPTLESRMPQMGYPLLNERKAGPNPHPLPAFPLDQLRRLVPMQDGDVFSITKLYDGFDAVEKLYKSEGYAEVSMTPTIAFDDSDHSASVTVELDEGKQFHVGKVEALGIDSGLIEKLQVALPKGETFHPDEVDAALKSVVPEAPGNRVELRENESEATVDITMDFRPCPPAK